MVARTTARKPEIDAEDVRPPIRERKRKGGNLVDKFALPQDMLDGFAEAGISVEWKRETVYGANDPGNEIFNREQGWLPVDGAKHPEVMLPGQTGPIRRDGLILMERPIELTREAQAEDRAAANDAVRIKEKQLGSAGKGEFQRERADGSSTVRVNRTMENGGISID